MKAFINEPAIIKFAALLSILFLTGCAGDIFRHQSVGGTSITAMDARQRVIIANHLRTVTETSGENKVKTSEAFMRFCAEPFPDIFTVVSSSVSAGLGAGATVDKEKQSAQANAVATIAAALKESGTAIERSQTVNLLGMSLYRTCERYMNGAITEDELKIQAYRDQQAMISILAIEQLTILARPASTKIILDGGLTEASAAVNQDNATAKKVVDDAKANLDTAKQLKELRIAGTKQTDKCEFDDVTKQALCDEATVKVDKASQAIKQAEEQLKNTTATATTKTGSAQTMHVVINDNRKPDIQTLNNETIQHIADTVLELAKLGTKFDCYQFMAIQKTGSSESKRICDETNKPDGEALALNIPPDIKAAVEGKACTTKNSNIVFYVQALKNCANCQKKAEDAKIAINTLLYIDNCETLVSYPIEYLEASQMPNSSEIRYFNDSDKLIAEKIALELKVNAKLFRLKSSPNVIEYWVGKNN